MTALAMGCSHTAGVGIEPMDCYVSVLGQMLDRPIMNLGVPGGNAAHVQRALVKSLKSTSTLDFVIAQWPNPIRRTVWLGDQPCDENIHNAGPAFRQLLRASENNFIQPWIDTIVVCNWLCKLAAVPIVNIMIEDVAPEYHAVLNSEGVQLHVDQKIPGKTWLMDSAASDNLHHSAQCHKQWAERLVGLIDELTK